MSGIRSLAPGATPAPVGDGEGGTASYKRARRRGAGIGSRVTIRGGRDRPARAAA